MAMGVWCAETRRKKGLVLCLMLTFILGMGFLGIKTIEYSEKIEKHHVPGFHYSLQSFINPASDPESTRSTTTSRWRRTWRATPRSTSRSTSP